MGGNTLEEQKEDWIEILAHIIILVLDEQQDSELNN
jgi:hypothetical protein